MRADCNGVKGSGGCGKLSQYCVIAQQT